jgi:hypothetical protein
MPWDGKWIVGTNLQARNEMQLPDHPQTSRGGCVWSDATMSLRIPTNPQCYGA